MRYSLEILISNIKALGYKISLDDFTVNHSTLLAKIRGHARRDYILR
jgi:EAL domain-containing protein (putative c-di-GMP-specific phosphodiesterase class I)